MSSGKVKAQMNDPFGKEDRDSGMRVVSSLIAGLLLYGGLGWLGDQWFDTKFLLPIGLVFGFVASVYVIIKRFGSVE